MTDESIESILSRLNKGQPNDIIIRQIGENVWWGFAWGATPEGFMLNGIQQQGEEFFFVKALDGQFAAAVLRMHQKEIHWYVCPQYRKRGILVEPLKVTILPFLFWLYDSATQAGTIDSERPFGVGSAKLAERVGFLKVGRSRDGDIYEISRNDVASYKEFRLPPGDPAELEGLKTDVQIINRSLRMILDIMRVRYSNHFKPEKGEGVALALDESMSYLLDIIEDARWSCKASNSGDQSVR